MTFLAPAMLWSLAALIPLTAIYFLKVRPRRKPTTAFFLWERIFQEHRATSLFQRLRDVLSLLLMLLAAAAICLALAQPQWSDDRQDLLIVVDVSASMAARDGGGTRLDAAKRLASDIVEGLNGVQRAAVATLGRRLEYQSHLTDNPRELLDAVERIQSTPESLDDDALAELAAAGNQWQRARRVLLISDGDAVNGAAKPVTAAGAKPSTLPAGLPAGVELLKVGAAAANVGIVAADLAYLPDEPDRLGVYLQLASTHAAPVACDVSLVHLDADGAERLKKVLPLTLKPGVNPPERLVVDEAEPGRWLARVDPGSADDALAADDTAWLMARRPPPVRVAVESADRYFLENSVLAFADGGGLLDLVEENAEAVVAKDAAPAANLAIIFHPTGEAPWWSDLGDEVEVVAPRVMIADHPVLRHLDAATIPFAGARRLTAPPGAQVLVADDSGLPLLYVAGHEGRTAIVANLDPVAAEFYFSAWFPVLVHSAVTHLVGREAPLPAAVRPGDAVTLPAGAKAAVAAATAQPQRVPSKLGFHAWTSAEPRPPAGQDSASPTPEAELAVSLLSERETLLASAAADSRQPLNTGSSPVRWLTTLALVVLTGESLLYHRRKVG